MDFEDYKPSTFWKEWSLSDIKDKIAKLERYGFWQDNDLPNLNTYDEAWLSDMREYVKLQEAEYDFSKDEERSLYVKAIKYWQNHQVNMAVEEAAELIANLALLIQRVMKLNRESDSGITTPEDVKNDIFFMDMMDKVAEEMADSFITLSQFDDTFEALFKKWKHKKLIHLKNKVTEHEKQQDKKV